MTLMKSLWSVIGLCNCSGKLSTAYGARTWPFSTVGAGMSYARRICSWGTARKPSGQEPSSWTKAMWSRWLALSMFWPSQQLWKLTVRSTWLPSGHSGYLSVTCRSSKPEQLQEALALASPLVKDLASPVMTRRNFGIATTSPCRLPTNLIRASAGLRILPMLPSAPPPWSFASNSSVPS